MPKIRWYKHRKKFTVNIVWFVLEPLVSKIRLSAKYLNQLPAVRYHVRADACTPSSSSGCICAFSSWVSLTGEVLPVPDCRIRADTPDRLGNQEKTLDYRSHIVSTWTHLWSQSWCSFLSPPFALLLRKSALYSTETDVSKIIYPSSAKGYWCFIEIVHAVKHSVWSDIKNDLNRSKILSVHGGRTALDNLSVIF